MGVKAICYHDYRKQLTIEEIFQLLDGRLRRDNHWIRLSTPTPWEYIEKIHKNVREETGYRSIFFQVAFGGNPHQRLLHPTTEGAVHKNSYVQYSVILHMFQIESLLDLSMLMYVYKKFSEQEVERPLNISSEGRGNMHRNDSNAYGNEPLAHLGDNGEVGQTV